VLVNKNNHGQWAKVVSDDVLQHVYSLKNGVCVLAGQVRGKTLLPMPAGAEFDSCMAASDVYVFMMPTVFLQCGRGLYFVSRSRLKYVLLIFAYLLKVCSLAVVLVRTT